MHKHVRRALDKDKYICMHIYIHTHTHMNMHKYMYILSYARMCYQVLTYSYNHQAMLFKSSQMPSSFNNHFPEQSHSGCHSVTQYLLSSTRAVACSVWWRLFEGDHWRRSDCDSCYLGFLKSFRQQTQMRMLAQFLPKGRQSK